MNPLNLGTLTGGITADPEIRGTNVAKLRVAVDYAGRDSANPDNRTGYFDVTYFLNDDTPNGKFVSAQIRDGKMKRGSQITLSYSLEHQRWETDGSKRSAVGLIAHAITYTPTSRARDDAASTQGPADSQVAGEAGSGPAVPFEF